MTLKNFKNLTKKQRLIIAITAAAILVAAITVTLILVLGDKGPAPGGDEWSETGVYYFDAKYDEYTLTLSEGDTFALVVKGEIAFGSYTLEDGALTLDSEYVNDSAGFDAHFTVSPKCQRENCIIF